MGLFLFRQNQFETPKSSKQFVEFAIFPRFLSQQFGELNSGKFSYISSESPVFKRLSSRFVPHNPAYSHFPTILSNFSRLRTRLRPISPDFSGEFHIFPARVIFRLQFGVKKCLMMSQEGAKCQRFPQNTKRRPKMVRLSSRFSAGQTTVWIRSVVSPFHRIGWIAWENLRRSMSCRRFRVQAVWTCSAPPNSTNAWNHFGPPP